MKLREFIANTIREYLNENVNNTDIKDILIKRIPFLQEYNIFKHPTDEKRLVAQRIVSHDDVKLTMGDEILNFPRFTVSSNISYYSYERYDKTFHIFIIENALYALQPKEMDDLTYRFFLIANKKLEENLSYMKEIVKRNNEDILKNELDEVINDMNGKLFKIEEFTEKYYINLF